MVTTSAWCNRDTRPAPLFIRALKDPSGGIRVNALYSLMEIGSPPPSVATQILKCLEDEQWYVRQTACMACAQFKIASAKKQLLKRTQDPKKAVHEVAKKALTCMG